MAAENNHLDVVDLLLQHKAFVNAKNKAGVTPAHLAAERGAADIVDLLVNKYQANADILSLVSQNYIFLKTFILINSGIIYSPKRHPYILLPKLVSSVFAID